MDNDSKFTLTIGIVVVLIFLGFGLGLGFLASENKKYRQEIEEMSLGGVPTSHEYYATNTRNMTGTLMKAAKTDQVIATSTGRGISITLGSVIVASTTGEWMDIYDATSSAAITDGTYPSLITRLPTSTPQGTYTYDAALTYGLVLRMYKGFAGDYVVTYRR